MPMVPSQFLTIGAQCTVPPVSYSLLVLSQVVEDTLDKPAGPGSRDTNGCFHRWRFVVTRYMIYRSGRHTRELLTGKAGTLDVL